MPGLTAFQDAFAAALAGEAQGLTPWLDAPVGQPGLEVYRNTTIKGSLDALAANFPAVARLVGEEWFRAAAAVFSREHPPARASLLDYGVGFADWLERFEPAQALPYLAGVARLDRLWTEAHLAVDAQALDAGALAGLDAQEIERTAVVVHSSVRLVWFTDNTPSLWLANRGPAEPHGAFEFIETGEGALIARPALAVEARVVDRPTYAFVAACLEGESLAKAAAAAMDADANTDLGQIVAETLEAGLITGLSLLSEPQP